MECWVTDSEREDPREAVHDSSKTGTDIRGRDIEEGTGMGIIVRKNKGGNESGRNRNERSREEAELVRAYAEKRRALRIGRRTMEVEN